MRINIERDASMTAQSFGRGFLIMLATAIVAGVAFYVLQAHWAHALGLAPYLLFLACPLMHIFMHRGHKHHDPQSKDQRRQNTGAGCH
jgi:hypothetical protein